MEYVRIRNLSRYQHYRHRNPPWVKLYFDILNDPDLMRLDDASKWLAVGLLLVASRSNNHIPNDPQWLSHTLHTSQPVDLTPLKLAMWIEDSPDASNVLAKCSPQSSSLSLRSTEAEPKSFASAMLAENRNGNSNGVGRVKKCPTCQNYALGGQPCSACGVAVPA